MARSGDSARVPKRAAWRTTLVECVCIINCACAMRVGCVCVCVCHACSVCWWVVCVLVGGALMLTHVRRV